MKIALAEMYRLVVSKVCVILFPISCMEGKQSLMRNMCVGNTLCFF